MSEKVKTWLKAAGIRAVKTMAQAAIAGQYGTGDDRRNALGDLYDQVQARVNEMM